VEPTAKGDSYQGHGTLPTRGRLGFGASITFYDGTQLGCFAELPRKTITGWQKIDPKPMANEAIGHDLRFR
jgi:hypothetical protein